METGLQKFSHVILEVLHTCAEWVFGWSHKPKFVQSESLAETTNFQQLQPGKKKTEKCKTNNFYSKMHMSILSFVLDMKETCRLFISKQRHTKLPKVIGQKVNFIDLII